MVERLMTNVRVNLKFYRRNRILAGVGILMVALSMLYAGGSILFSTSTGRFDLTRELFQELTSFSFMFVSLVGLVLVSVHVRGKAVKLIFTKPCPPDVWLGAAFISAVFVAFVLYTSIFLVTMILSLVWSVPLQPGFAFMAAELCLEAIISMAYLTFLSMVMHPVIAIIIAVIFNESVFFAMRTGLIAAIEYTGGNVLLPFLEKATYVLYLITPMYRPFAREIATVGASMRVGPEQWKYLAFTAGYAVAASVLFYLLSLAALRRKNFV